MGPLNELHGVVLIFAQAASIREVLRFLFFVPLLFSSLFRHCRTQRCLHSISVKTPNLPVSWSPRNLMAPRLCSVGTLAAAPPLLRRENVQLRRKPWTRAELRLHIVLSCHLFWSTCESAAASNMRSAPPDSEVVVCRPWVTTWNSTWTFVFFQHKHHIWFLIFFFPSQSWWMIKCWQILPSTLFQPVSSPSFKGLSFKLG